MRDTLRIATRLFLAVAVAGAAACGGGSDGSTGPSDPGPSAPSNPAEVGGSYALKQVRTLGHLGGGGSGLPVTFVDGAGHQLTFKSGTLVLGTDGTFDMKVQVTLGGNSGDLTDSGTYSVSGGGVIDFDSQKATPRLSTGTVSGNKITAQSQFAGIPFEIDVER